MIFGIWGLGARGMGERAGVRGSALGVRKETVLACTLCNCPVAPSGSEAWLALPFDGVQGTVSEPTARASRTVGVGPQRNQAMLKEPLLWQLATGN
jgi:hypothetical protein